MTLISYCDLDLSAGVYILSGINFSLCFTFLYSLLKFALAVSKSIMSDP